MFNKKIRELLLTSDVANALFKIRGDSFLEDRSFVATLRALLHKRAQDVPIRLFVSSSNWDCAEVGAAEDEALFAGVTGAAYDNDTVVFQMVRGTTEDAVDAIFSRYDNAAKGFVAHFPCYRELQDLKLFVQSKIDTKARFYIDEERRVTIILTEDIGLRKYHFIQSLIPRFLPWFFKEAPLTQEEIALLLSLTHRYSTDYERIMQEIGGAIDLRAHIIKSIIGDFEKSGRREEIRNTERQISNAKERVAEYMERYRSLMDELDRLNIVLNGQQMALESNSDESELIDYFSCNKGIMPVQVSGRKLYFTVKTFFESFDPELYATYIKNETSFFFTGYDYLAKFSDKAVRRKMLDAIFSDEPILKVKMCANYIISLNGSSDAIRNYHYDDTEFRDYIPNPHIQYFACLGNYRPFIDRAIKEGNIIGAIEQCIASAKSLNLTEAHTTRYFLNELFRTTKNVIQLPDGRSVTPSEALDYLNSLDTKKEDANE